MKKLKSKKNIFISILLLVISTTVAYLYSTDTFQNIFVAASYKVTVVETFESPDNWKPGDTTPKTVTLKNEGTVPIKVRVKLEEEWKDSNGENLALTHKDENVAVINFSNAEDYIYKDGYYYYDLALNPGETTSSIIESVTFNPNYSGTITCVENDDSTHSCSSSESGYEGGTYKLTLTIEGVQEDYYVQAWGLSGLVQHQYLYDVLKDETESGGVARKYTGEHHDSFVEEPSKNIYKWHASNNAQSTEVTDKNNVIFAGQCFQMLRTTDTGGVKMVYNGDVEDGKCLNTRGNHVGYSGTSTQNMTDSFYYGTSYIFDKNTNKFSLDGVITTGAIQTRQYTCKATSATSKCSTLYYIDKRKDENNYYTLLLNPNSFYSYFGKLAFNVNSSSFAYVGYMYNRVYSIKNTSSSSENVLVSSQLSTNYYYASSYDYNETNSNKYTLENPYTISSADDYASLVGKYTFKSSSSTYSNNKIFYIASVSGTTMYVIELEGGNNLEYYNYLYTYGDSYTDNGDGTYTINDSTTIERKDWYSEYSKIKNKYLCVNAINNTCSNIRHVSNTDTLQMVYYKSNDKYYFANSFTYDSTIGKYKLSDDRLELWDTIASDFNSKINTRHYTCFSESDECSQISYIFNNSSGTLYYINLKDGKSIKNAVDEMLYDDNVNTVNSTIKTGVDAWYERYLLNYSDYLEDIIFCNNRIQSNSQTNGWNPSGSVTSQIWFLNTTSLSCQNETDKFSTLNDKAKLKYKVGLMNRAELLSGVNLNKYLWLTSPSSFSIKDATINYLNMNGSFYPYNLSAAVGVAPVISLKPGIEYSDGEGSMENPYIIKMN